MKSAILLTLALCNSFAVSGFAPAQVKTKSSRISKPFDRYEDAQSEGSPKQYTGVGGRSTPLFSTTNKEQALRDELREKASKLEDDKTLQYASQIGPEDEDEEKPLVKDLEEGDESEIGKLKRKMEKLTRKRAYALFLAEKGAEIIEGLLPAQEVGIPKKRERIVVLGTGWGAASFLKGIDTRIYDVTVISPRNYFLFTPMLAGASVGTVEYRYVLVRTFEV